jgi:formylglycine-generating enzyme required for sulfatase activity
VYILNGVDWNALTYAAIPPSNNAAWDEAAMNPAADGYRLPTEMEWMWAAMGADTAATGMRNTGGYTKPFAGSGTLDNNAWHYGNSGNKTHEVKKKDANELGLYDMSGNVYEWTYDWWTESYPAGTLVSPTGADSGVNRVVRGGNWNSTAPICMVAYRPSINPGKRDSSIIGFRVVRAE